jgi:predicted site-specific integrase-resolvase
MNVMEAAMYLFVSRPHVRVLVERGALTGTPTESGDYEIDEVSVEKYAADRKRAAKEYLDSQTEDNDPLGL